MRVLITRPRLDAERVATRLQAMEHVPIIAPVIAIVPLQVALPAAPVDAVAITSRHALAPLCEADRARLRGRPLFVVGDASARVAREGGWRDVRVAAGDGQALRDLVRLTLRRPARLLYLAGHVHRPALADGLRLDGYDVETMESYDAVATPWEPGTGEALRRDPPGAVLHFSRRSAELFLRVIAEDEDRGWVAKALHLCLSGEVAAPLIDAGVTQVTVAPAPETDALLEALGVT